MRPLSVTSASAAETQAVAARFLPVLSPGDLILLGGELGTGKTTFTQGLARAMGITEPVTSPTFTLMRTYEGDGLRLLHADLYRLEHVQEVIDLGFGEWLDDGAVAVVEWGDVAGPVIGPDYLEVRIDFGATDDERTVSVAGVGARWVARLPRLRGLLSAR